MRRILYVGLMCALAAGFSAPFPVTTGLYAAPKEKLLPAGRLKLAGRYVRCGRTPTLMSHTFWDYGGAKKGMIILNPSKLEGLSEAVRLYVYAHECGHQKYGSKETKADCYAVKRGRREGWLTRDGMNEICTFMEPKPGDWVHPPGPQRCEIMTKCFERTKPRRAQK